MAIDPSRLTQSELLQLVNATPLGVVLTRSRLRRQMDAAALRFGDGTHIHLVRYVRWLVGEMDKPRPTRMDYAEARRRQAERNRAATKASQDVFPVPEVEDYTRRQACAESFRLFCETYFAAAFHRAWSGPTWWSNGISTPARTPKCQIRAIRGRLVCVYYTRL